jgi:hypothetical protein
MISIESCPIVHEFYPTETEVTGGNKALREEALGLVDKFIESGAFGLMQKAQDGAIGLVATKRDITGIRGTGDVRRIDIQGPQGDDAARIAFQVGKLVLAQVILPLNTRVTIDDLKSAFVESLTERKVVSFAPTTDENIPPSNSQKKGKGPRRR